MMFNDEMDRYNINIKKLEKEASMFICNILFSAYILILTISIFALVYNVKKLDNKYNNLKKLVIIQDNLLIKSIEEINGNK